MNKKVGRFSRREFLKVVSALAGGLAVRPTLFGQVKALAQDVPSVEPINILINQSPWFNGFAATVDMYSEMTGNQVNLDITPFPDMVNKARNATTSSESEFDLVNLTEAAMQLFYDGGLVTPVLEIDPDYEWDPNVITYGDAARWDYDLRTSTPDGVLQGLPINGNIQLYYYRKDLLDEAGMAPAQTFDEMEAIAEHFHNPPQMFGNANRAAPIWWEYGAYMVSYGAEYVELNPETGAWSIGYDKPEALDAVNRWLTLGRDWAPQNYADLGQADILALMASGRLPQVHMVGAAAPNYDDPNQSVVGGNMGATVVPGVTPETRSPRSGIWVMSAPDNMAMERKVAGLTFLKWLLQKDVQIAYTLAGAIPVRQDAYEELATDPLVGWWTSAFAESTQFIKPDLRLPETGQIRERVLTRMSQAYVDEITPEETVENLAMEIREIMEDAGYTLE